MKYQPQEKMIFMLSWTLGESNISKFKNLSRSFTKSPSLHAKEISQNGTRYIDTVKCKSNSKAS